MIFDKELELVAFDGLDLGSLGVGPGNPIKMWADKQNLSIVITTGADRAEAEAGLTHLITVNSKDVITFELPSNTQRWIATNTELTAGCFVILPGAQSAT